MDALTIYAIAAGGIFVAFFLTRALISLKEWRSPISVFVSRHLTFPYLVGRHQLFGPWTRASVCFHLLYGAINIFLVLFRASSLSNASRQAGTLAVINLIFLLSAMHLSYLADLLGVTLRICRRIHSACGWMVVMLQAFHIIMELLVLRNTFPVHKSRNICAVISAASLGMLALLTVTWFRRWSYEIFIRAHQLLAGLCVYGLWRHLPSDAASPRLYIYIGLGIFGMTSSLQFATFLYRNGLFAGCGSPRAVVSCDHHGKSSSDGVGTASVIKVTLILPRPVRVKAGQYINLWMPSVSLWSWAQTHPFMVTSWSRGKQDTLDLLVQPQRGMTADLLRQAHAIPESSVSFLAFFTGPHGINAHVNLYENALVVASGFGIAAVIPYVKEMIHGYNTCTSQIRRLHLVWQVESIDIAIATQGLLNSLLKDDIMDDGYILSISIYVENGQLVKNKLPFGKHERAFLYQGIPDYQNIVSSEVSGDQIERLPNIRDEHGRMLVIVSAADSVRDQVREIVRGYLHQRVKLLEVEYQP